MFLSITYAHILYALKATGKVRLLKHNLLYNALFKKLHSILLLKPDWDGYDGVAPSKNTVEASNTLLNKCQLHFFPAPKIMISGSGEVGFYWEQNNQYAEIIVHTPTYYTFVHIKNNKTYSEENVLLKKDFSLTLITKISAFETTAEL